MTEQLTVLENKRTMDLYCKVTQDTDLELPLIQYAETRLSGVRLPIEYFNIE